MYLSSVHYPDNFSSVDGVQSVYLSNHVSNEYKGKWLKLKSKEIEYRMH